MEVQSFPCFPSEAERSRPGEGRLVPFLVEVHTHHIPPGEVHIHRREVLHIHQGELHNRQGELRILPGSHQVVVGKHPQREAGTRPHNLPEPEGIHPLFLEERDFLSATKLRPG